MPIQPTDFEPVMPAPSAIGPGGNCTLTNQDEDNLPAAQYERTPVRISEWYGREDDSHCQGVYRRGEI